jgi:predicted ATPase
MLTKIAVQGLFNELDYEIPLMDGHLTFIHAQNGFGKSTLMRLVYNILQGNLEDVRVVPFERLDLVFDDQSNLIIENRNQELTILMSKNRLEEPVDADDLPSLLGSLYIGPERMYLSDGMGNLKPSIDVYMKELSDSIRRAIADSEVVPKSEDSKKYTDAELDEIFKNAEAKINFIRQAGFQPSIPSGYRFPPSRFDISDNHEKYKALALTLKAYTDTYYHFAESIVVYLDIVNTLFVNKTVEINDKGFPQARMDRSGTVIPISKFSSGEKQILIMFYLLLFKAGTDSLVIMDEPEVSLHVSWQQQIGKFVSDVARIRNLQVIISTHSPSVIHDDWDKTVELSSTRTD